MRVLVVEDDDLVRKTVLIALEKAGIKVSVASGGKQAVQLFRTTQPDLVLCDIYMPELDGLEVIRSLTREFRDARIIAMTSGEPWCDCDVLSVALRLGATAVLPKPFDSQQLLAAVNAVMQDA